MFASLKNFLLRRSTRAYKRYSSVQKQFFSFSNARTVGVLFMFEKNAVPKEVQQFLSLLKNNRQFYFALGYCDQRSNPTNFISTNRVAAFNRTDTNWYNRPTSDSVSAFLHQNYDIVINLHREYIAPLAYITRCVNASTLVGGHYYEGCPYDLIVDAQKTCDLDGYIKQVHHYLEIMTHPQSNKQ